MALLDDILGRILAPVLDRIDLLEDTMTTSEQQTRDALADAITGTLAHLADVETQRDAYRDALADADANAAAQVAAARNADSTEDAAWNAGQVERLAALATTPTDTTPAEPNTPTPGE